MLAAPIVCVAMVHFVFFASPRYQVPILPFLIAFIPLPMERPRD